MKNDYLERILRARVYDVAIETPLEVAPNLSARLGNRVLLKREDMQPVFSFECRGAYNKMVNLPAAALARGVIASSAGNHAQGVALAAQKLGCARGDRDAVHHAQDQDRRGQGARRRGDPARRHLRRGARRGEAPRSARAGSPSFIPTTIPTSSRARARSAWRSCRQSSQPPDAVFVAVGGGGLISGIASYIKRAAPLGQGDRRRAGRRRRHGALAQGGPARRARSRGPVRRRRRGEAGGRADASRCAASWSTA